MYAQIMHFFRYNYRHEWAPENIFDGKSRLWVQAFNDLIKKKFILKRRKLNRYEYKWGAVWPY